MSDQLEGETRHTCPECDEPVENLNDSDAVPGYWYCEKCEVKWFAE